MADIREKIQKLLALAGSSNENEAKSAMLKAKELMAKNKLSEIDFEDQKKQVLVHLTCNEIKWTSDSGDIWMTNLCKLIADEYMCIAAWSHEKGHRTYTLVLTGMEEDANLCKDIIEYAVGFVRGRIKILERKSTHSRRTVAKSYVDGFILGLELAFEQQKEDHPEWGLVVVKPEEVNNYEKTLGNRKVKTKKPHFDPLSYLKGQTDGQNFNAKRVIESA